ncbi:MAG: hypothetical protein OXG18_05440 [Gemmatimonadetes bacterium]|nr:hypothetical protein [Gemmatimonadota bacterium]
MKRRKALKADYGNASPAQVALALHRSEAVARDSTAFESTDSGASVSAGPTTGQPLHAPYRRPHPLSSLLIVPRADGA